MLALVILSAALVSGPAPPEPTPARNAEYQPQIPLRQLPAVAKPAEAKPSLWKATAVYAAAIAPELAITEWGIARGTATEANPLLRRRAVRIASLGAEAFAIGWVDTKLRTDGHTKAARWLRVSVITVRLGLAVLDYRTATHK